MSYKVSLQSFEGPFDLLVYLIENAQMSIYDIKISEITSQYLEYVEEIKALDVNVATEFMVLAATLIDIKTKMILPRSVLSGGEVIDEDPRSELVERILEYKKFKKGAEIFKEKEEYMSLVYEKPQEDISEYLDNPDEILSLDIGQFANAFELFLRKKKREEDVRSHYTKIERERATIESRMSFIAKKFKSAITRGVRRLSFKEFIPDKKDRYDVVVTFVSVLQMMRDKYLDAEQSSTYGEITIIPGEREIENEQQENN